MTDRYATARKHLREADPVLAVLIDEHPDFDPRAWMTGLPKMDAFGALLFQIVGQQLSVIATRAIVTRLRAIFDGNLPTAREILEADPEAIRGAGLSRRKVETMRSLAERFVTGEFGDEKFRESSDEDIEAALTTISGIGPWTVRGFLIIALDRPDVVPLGDLALRRAVKNVYGLAQMPTQLEMQQLAERWRPYRSLAVMYLFASEVGT